MTFTGVEGKNTGRQELQPSPSKAGDITKVDGGFSFLFFFFTFQKVLINFGCHMFPHLISPKYDQERKE